MSKIKKVSFMLYEYHTCVGVRYMSHQTRKHTIYKACLNFIVSKHILNYN